MGKFVWHDWGRLLALATATYYTWAGIWGIFFRKFFWDMIDGTLTSTGFVAPLQSQGFVAVTVKFPLLQILIILGGLFALALEWPLNFFKGSAFHRSFVFRGVVYFFFAFLGSLVYQTVDTAVYWLVVSTVYTRAHVLGEQMEKPRGRSGMAA